MIEVIFALTWTIIITLFFNVSLALTFLFPYHDTEKICMIAN